MPLIISGPDIFVLMASSDSRPDWVSYPVQVFEKVFDLTATRIAHEKGWGREPLARISAAIDIACRDIIGKVANLPLYRILNDGICDYRELARYAALMAAFNECQLREVLTQFWDNHFSTYYFSVRSKSGADHFQTTQWELAENDAFRINALGNFRDLLMISARSPTMLYCLDGVDKAVHPGTPRDFSPDTAGALEHRRGFGRALAFADSLNVLTHVGI